MDPAERLLSAALSRETDSSDRRPPAGLAFVGVPSSWQPNDGCSSTPEAEDDSFLEVSGKVFPRALYEPSQYFFLKAFSPLLGESGW